MTFILWLGAAGALLFPVIFLLDGWTRPGYRPVYHPVSALALGPRGWIQTTNFVVCGAAIAAAGIALGLAWDTVFLPVVVSAFGLSLVASGAFAMDPMRGYPPGTPAGDPDEFSRQHTLHDWAGMFVFGLAPLAALIAAWVLPGTSWRIYSVLTAAAGIAAFIAFGQAWESDHPRTGLVQRLAIIVGWLWLALLFVRTAGGAG